MSEILDVRVVVGRSICDDDGRDRPRDLGVHREDRNRRLGHGDALGLVNRAQLENEEMQAIFLPRVGRELLRHLPSHNAIFG